VFADVILHHQLYVAMKLSQMLSAALLASVPTPVQAYTGPIGCLGDCFTHDPAVVKRSDGKYFRFSSQDLIGIWTADDLLGPWARSGSVISDASVINLPGNTELWVRTAPRTRQTYVPQISINFMLSGSRCFVYSRHLLPLLRGFHPWVPAVGDWLRNI
jgi:arabinan endo-1,5-alpha-L-arabinosidase